MTSQPRPPHLTEDERQGVADGTLPAARMNDVATHLDTCDACAADVARLSRLMNRIHDAPAPLAAADDLWPLIRARIEHSKVLSLPPGEPAGPGTPADDRRPKWIALAAAAAVIVVTAAVVLRRGPEASPNQSSAVDGGQNVSVVAESTQAYQREAQTLLNELELRRAMLRPETAASVDKSLRVIDQAIAELQDAVLHDPNNPALRRLLASSYRQKIDLLKRVENAS